MGYLVALLVPPLAVLMCNKPGEAILNVVLCFFFWIPGIIHALLVVNGYEADQRVKKLAIAMAKQNLKG